jgi:CHAT domain-containing protein/Tfp pilus assembly protein PilF
MKLLTSPFRFFLILSFFPLLCVSPEFASAQSPASTPEQLKEQSSSNSGPAARQDPLAEATALNQQVLELFRQGKYAEALGLAKRALELREKALGPDNVVVASSLNQLAGIYLALGDYARVEPLLLRMLKFREEFLGANSLSFAQALNNVAVFYQRMGNVRQAEELLLRALKIVESVKGADSADVALALGGLAAVYQDEGKYEQAEEKYVQALELWKKIYGEQHENVALSLNNLASLYLARAEYVRAEPLLRQALTVRENNLGGKHPDVAISLSNLASLYRSKGDYERAEQLMLRALSIIEGAQSKEHPQVAAVLNNLAGLYMDKGDLPSAEKHFRRALAIREKALGPEHPDTAISFNGLAALYREQGDYAQAVEMNKRSLAIYRNAFGPEHPDVAMCLNNLGVLYQDEGDYVLAEQMLLQALQIREKALGAEHPDVAVSLSNLSTLYESKNDLAQAVRYLTRSTEISERNLALILTTGSENQKRLYMQTLNSETFSTISLHAHLAPDNLEAARLALTIILRRKGRALDAMTDQIGALRRRFNRQDRELLDKLSESQTRLATLVLNGPGMMTPAQYRARVEKLNAEIEELEAQVSARSALFRVETEPVTLEHVQRAIPSDAALVEFVSYRPFNPRAKSLAARFGPERYAAYVLWSQGSPAFVDLGEAAHINQSVAKLGKALADPDSPNVKQAARALYEQLMSPVRRLLRNTHNLLLSPDGALNLIPFAALIDEQGRYLLETYTINYLTSGRDLLKLEAHAETKHNRQQPLVFANPAYDLAVVASSASSTPPDKTRGRRSGRLSQIKWSPLIGTAEEASALKNILSDAQILTGTRASEANIKRVAGPRILHIATHGFFLSDEAEKSTAVESKAVSEREAARANKGENPLLRSGLVLAGANKQQSGSGEDGVLTALEAAGLDLWSTRLVVLSACETGVGEIRNGEGVYGLRRALVLAGAESQLMSLWQVSDRETRELMVGYYRRLQRGAGRTEALRQVQLAMLRRRSSSHPYYWASFIPVGDWKSLDDPQMPHRPRRRVRRTRKLERPASVPIRHPPPKL